MLTTNIDIGDRLINGQMGTVTKIEVNQNTQKPTVIYIKFDDNEAGRNVRAKCPNPFARENTVVPIEPVLTRIKVRPGKPSSPEIQRIQFPLTLAYSCTVHKVQGLTLQNVVISFNLNKQRSFNYGQIYVALSRSTSLQGIHILGQIESKHVKANPKVHEEYQRLRDISSIPNMLQSTHSNNTDLTICLLNVRSLRKHSIDIKFDANIFNSDVMTLTETQLLPNDTDREIRNNLHPFILYRQDHVSDKYSSLAVCIKDSIEITEHQYFPSINALKFVILNNITQQSQSFLMLYRKQASNMSHYISSMEHILKNYDFDVVMGDFNINYFNENDVRPLKSLMTSLNYSQIVQQPTFISSGSLLDHIYLRPTAFDIIENNIITVYYSDHDAIQIIIRKL